MIRRDYPSPEELKKLTVEQLETLAADIRAFLISTISTTAPVSSRPTPPKSSGTMSTSQRICLPST